MCVCVYVRRDEMCVETKCALRRNIQRGLYLARRTVYENEDKTELQWYSIHYFDDCVLIGSHCDALGLARRGKWSWESHRSRCACIGGLELEFVLKVFRQKYATHWCCIVAQIAVHSNLRS